MVSIERSPTLYVKLEVCSINFKSAVILFASSQW